LSEAHTECWLFGANSVSSFEYQNDALGRRSQRVDNNIDYSVAKTNSFAYNYYSEVTNAVMNTDDYGSTFESARGASTINYKP